MRPHIIVLEPHRWEPLETVAALFGAVAIGFIVRGMI